MNRLANNQKISKIVMRPDAYARCELGGDWYKNKLEIVFVPAKYYPDYTEVQTWIMENIDGKTLNIEDVIELVADMLGAYEPQKVTITDKVEDCRTHFDVEITTERVYENE